MTAEREKEQRIRKREAQAYTIHIYRNLKRTLLNVGDVSLVVYHTSWFDIKKSKNKNRKKRETERSTCHSHKAVCILLHWPCVAFIVRINNAQVFGYH